MADCSKTLDYAKEHRRMCDAHSGCLKCPLNDRSCGTDAVTQEYIDIVQKWSDEHPDIKPCPFCGKSDTVEIECDSEHIYVFCNTYNDGCGASSGYCNTEEEALELWNKRVDVK